MEQIHLNKELLSEEIFKDVLFIVFSSVDAMSDAGVVRFINQAGTEYFFNFIEDDLKCADVELLFPPLKQFKKDGIALDECHLLYLGLGTSMAIRDEVFSAFRYFAKEYPIKNYKLFQNWRKVVATTLLSGIDNDSITENADEECCCKDADSTRERLAENFLQKK